MKAQFRVSPVITVELEADTQKELFAELYHATEVFGEKKCGCCSSADIVFRVREVNDDEYFEMACMAEGCGAKLAFGQSKKGGTLFPIRKLIPSGPEAGKPSREHGEYGKHNGWTKFRGVKKDEPQQPPTPTKAPEPKPTTPPPPAQAKPAQQAKPDDTPANGADLYKRVRSKENELREAGLCDFGELATSVDAFAQTYPEDVMDWNRDQVHAAYQHAKREVQRLMARKKAATK